jgi:hypothetical protein
MDLMQTKQNALKTDAESALNHWLRRWPLLSIFSNHEALKRVFLLGMVKSICEIYLRCLLVVFVSKLFLYISSSFKNLKNTYLRSKAPPGSWYFKPFMMELTLKIKINWKTFQALWASFCVLYIPQLVCYLLLFYIFKFYLHVKPEEFETSTAKRHGKTSLLQRILVFHHGAKLKLVNLTFIWNHWPSKFKRHSNLNITIAIMFILNCGNQWFYEMSRNTFTYNWRLCISISPQYKHGKTFNRA